MSKALLLLLMLLGLCLQVYCINQMNIFQTFIGHNGNDYFGEYMISADFNGDGCEDLFVSKRGNPNYLSLELKGYFGGTVMDTIPDLIRLPGYNYQNPGRRLINAGDINGDGYEDIADVEYMQDDYTHLYLRFFYGGNNPDLIPDHEIILDTDDSHDQIINPTGCIGDINNDGLDDLGIILKNHNYRGMGIMLGGSFQLVTMFPADTLQYMYSINGIGDVNGDGIDDFMIGRTDPATDLTTLGTMPSLRFVYFGHNGYINLSDYIQIPVNIDYGGWSGGYGIGDFNGDGYDDIVTDNITDINEYDQMIKLGSSTLPVSAQIPVSNGYYNQLMDFTRNGVGHGDFNGDGYSDIVGCNYRDMINAGKAAIWLGNANPDGFMDLFIPPPETSPDFQFGWALTTGDFNGDGFCDFAISAPQDQGGAIWYPGYVYIYAGNGGLTALKDNVNPITVNDEWQINMYPNPIGKGKNEVHYKIEGHIPKVTGKISLNIYNIKGQIISRKIISKKDIQNKTGSIYLDKLKRGSYIARLTINSISKTSKFIVK